MLSFQNSVPILLEDISHKISNEFLVLCKKDRFGTSGNFDWRFFLFCLFGFIVDLWKIDLERSALTSLGIDPNIPAALLDNSVDSRKTKSSSFASLLGRIEGLEDVL